MYLMVEIFDILGCFIHNNYLCLQFTTIRCSSYTNYLLVGGPDSLHVSPSVKSFQSCIYWNLFLVHHFGVENMVC